MDKSAGDKMNLSVEDVAKTLGTTPLNVLLFVKRGQLKGKEEDGRWFIDPESFAEFLQSPAARSGSAPCRSACSRSSHCGTCDH